MVTFIILYVKAITEVAISHYRNRLKASIVQYSRRVSAAALTPH